jgi:hypothetical protein
MEGESFLKKQKITKPPIMALSLWFHLIFPHLSLRDWIAMKRLNRAFANYEKLNHMIKNTEEECFGDVPKKHWDRLDDVEFSYKNELDFLEKYSQKFLLLITFKCVGLFDKNQYTRQNQLKACISKKELLKEARKIIRENRAFMDLSSIYFTSYCVELTAIVPDNTYSFVIRNFYLSGVKVAELIIKSE